MSDERLDVMMGEDDLLFKNEDIVLGTGEEVIMQNLRHRLIEDGRIFHLFKSPENKAGEILDHCVDVIEQDEDVLQHTFGWQKAGDEVTFSGRLASGVLIDLPWQVNDGS